MIIDLLKIIELKKVLEENFGTYLSVHDTCGGQYFSVKNISPTGKNYIKTYFKNMDLDVIFNSDDTEFHLREIKLC